MKWTDYCKNSDAAVDAIRRLEEHNLQEQENWNHAPKQGWWDPNKGFELDCDYTMKGSPLDLVVENTVERTAYNLFQYYTDIIDGVDDGDKALRDEIEECFGASNDLYLIEALEKYAKRNHKLVGKVFDMFVEGKVELFDDGEEFFIAQVIRESA